MNFFCLYGIARSLAIVASAVRTRSYDVKDHMLMMLPAADGDDDDSGFLMGFFFFLARSNLIFMIYYLHSYPSIQDYPSSSLSMKRFSSHHHSSYRLAYSCPPPLSPKQVTIVPNEPSW